MLKNKNSQFNKFIWFLFAITIVITLAPFFKVGITSADDLGNYQSYLSNSVFLNSWIFAKEFGRFYCIITMPIHSLSYVGDNFIITKIIQHLSLLFSYSM